MVQGRVPVLVAAGGAAWEVEALRLLGAGPGGAVVIKRCIDLPDLLAAAATRQAEAAVVSAELPGLDLDAMSRLVSHGVAVVMVQQDPSADAPASAGMPGVSRLLYADDLSPLPASVRASAETAAHQRSMPPGDLRSDLGAPDGLHRSDDARAEHEGVEEPPTGRLTAVWGPAGAPGRTTVAVNLAAQLGRRGLGTLLLDADGYGGAVGQHLGVLDDVSGLLSAVRLANGGKLDVPALAGCARSVEPHLRVLTGLPRADRWVEVRPAPFHLVLATARRLAPHVILDLGFSLEQDPSELTGAGPQRNLMTVLALEQADEIVVVGSADPVGLARLARGLVELQELLGPRHLRVAVNRVRPSLGWGEREVRAMVEGFVAPQSLHFLPDDPTAVDRALVRAVPVMDVKDSVLSRALDDLAAAVSGLSSTTRGERRPLRLRRRRAGRAR